MMYFMDFTRYTKHWIAPQKGTCQVIGGFRTKVSLSNWVECQFQNIDFDGKKSLPLFRIKKLVRTQVKNCTEQKPFTEQQFKKRYSDQKIIQLKKSPTLSLHKPFKFLVTSIKL